MAWEKSQEFVESDVVEWVEAIWSPKKTRRRKKARPWGKQKVTAQITHIEGDYLKLMVLKAAVIENNVGTALRPHKVGTMITKKRSTLARGDSERLHWTEEEVRSALISSQTQ